MGDNRLQDLIQVLDDPVQEVSRGLFGAVSSRRGDSTYSVT